MRAGIATANDETTEFGEAGAARGPKAIVVAFVDRRGRTALVAVDRRARRSLAETASIPAAASADPAFWTATIH